PNDVKAARALNGLRDFAGVHAEDGVDEEGRQLRAFAPAERAALERGLGVREDNRELTEILAVLEPLVDLFDLGAGGIGALPSARGDVDQDVRDVVIELVHLGRFEAHETLVELARRYPDLTQHVALLELIEDQVPASFLAVRRV